MADPDLAPARTGAAGAVLPSEWRWVAVWTAAILIVTAIPYLSGWAVASETDQVFGGFVVGVEDGNSYLAKMGQGARGGWLFQSVYTSEPHDGALFFLFYILLGKVAAWLPGEPWQLPLRLIWVFHAARMACSAVLLRSVYRFVSHAVSGIAQRKLAWLLVAVGGGLGWLLVALGQGEWLGSMPLDFILPEGFTFLTIFTLPHIALARALLLEGLLVWLRLADTGKGCALVAGALWFLMALIVPFYPLVVGLVVGATLILRVVLGPAGSVSGVRRLVGRTIVAGILPGAVVLYTVWVFAANPVMNGWSQQNLVLSPHPLHYLAAYGVLGCCALLGAGRVVRQVRAGVARGSGLLVLAWVIVIPPFLYFPFNLQRRMIEGYQLPLSVLASIGLVQVMWPWLRARLARPRLGAAALVALCAGTPVVLVLGTLATVLHGAAPIFHSAGQVSVAEWLTRNAATGAVVLCEQGTGSFLPAWSPVRVYLGHGSETVNVAAKQEDVERFFGSTDDGWHEELLRRNGIGFVLHGPGERALGRYDPRAAEYLTSVFSSVGWELYEVVW